MSAEPKESKLDEGVEETFPASDPPSHSTTPKAEVVKKPRAPGEPHSPEGEDLARSGEPGASVGSQGG